MHAIDARRSVGTGSGEALPILRSDRLTKEQIESETGTVLGSRIARSSVRRIAILDSLEGKPVDAWDVSEAGDGSVWAWVKLSDVEGMYDIYIAGEGGVAAPENAGYLFSNYTSAAEISFGGAFDTSDVANMRAMFYGSSGLESLDLKNFDTTSVTDMSCMFLGCSGLTSLDVTGFDTWCVTDMHSMFDGCENLVYLDLTSFNTMNVTDMRWMFGQCSNLDRILVGEDFRICENAEAMFDGCPAKI